MAKKEKSGHLSLVQRRLLEPPSREPSDDLLFQHTVLCQASLPYRNPGDNTRQWDRKNGRAHLQILAGSAMHPAKGELVPVGLPFGAKPRLILSYLNAEALRTHNPEIEVEASLTAFVKRIGLDANGHSVKVVKDQLARLSASIVRLGVMLDDERAKTVHLPLVEEFELFFPKDERQRVLWPSFVRLNPTYFASLQKHAVPLHPHALGRLSHNAMALDMYAWLAQRLHRVRPGQPQFVTWKALKDQFGWHYGRMDNFRRVFRATLRTVLTQYRDAKLDENDGGIFLHHSPPPVLCRHSTVPRVVPHEKQE